MWSEKKNFTSRFKTELKGLALVLIVVVMIFPFETPVVPAWKIQVVDEAEHPISRIGIRQSWQNYSIESREHREDSITDDNGYVTFPARTVRASLLTRLIHPISNLRAGPHASWGSYSDVLVLVYDENKLGDALWSEGNPLPEQAVVRTMKRINPPQ
jgi:hypothetical protein